MRTGIYDRIPSRDEGREGEERTVAYKGTIRIYHKRNGQWHFVTLRRI